MRDVKVMGQQIGYRGLQWNWPKEAMNIPIPTCAGIVDGATLYFFLFLKLIVNHVPVLFFRFSCGL